MNQTRNTLINWVESGLLKPEDLEQAIELCDAKPNKKQWLKHLTTGLLWAAILFSSLGIIFFFAFNWNDMGRMTKFGLIEVTMLLCTPLIYKAFSSHTLLTTGLTGLSLLTGALLALVGQTYQTGADPWQLFATWSAFILPWTFIARSDALWSFWIVILNTALYLYLDIHHGLFGFLNIDELIALSFSALNTALLIIAELHYYQQSVQQQLTNRYKQQLLAIFAGCAITFLAISSIFNSHVNPLYFTLYLLWLGGAYFVYRYKHPDLFILSAVALSIIIVVISWLIEAIDTNLDDGGFFFITLAIITLSTLAGKWLKHIAQQFKELSNE